MTNWFEQYYPDLIKFAGEIILKRKINADPADLVNSSYLRFVESGNEFSLSDIKSYINSESWKEYTHSRSINFFGDSFTKHPPKITGGRCCSICGNVKPIGGFVLIKFDGYNYVTLQCRKCLNDKRIKWQKENKELWNTYMRNRRRGKSKTGLSKDDYNKKRSLEKKTIQELWNRANKKRYEKEKASLSDSYVKRVLKAAKKPFGPKEIEQKRKELYEKRRQAAAML